MVDLDACNNVEMEGVTLLGAPHWTVVPHGCENVAIRNIKLCGGRVQNDDGINPCNSRRILIEDCFLRTDDDCIAIKGLDKSQGDCSDIRIRRCVFWCDRARIALLGHESQADRMEDILFEDIDVIRFQMPVFLLEPGEGMLLRRFVARRIRIHAEPARTEGPRQIISVRPTVNQYMKDRIPGHVDDCLFEEIEIYGTPGDYRFDVADFDETHRSTNVRITGEP